MNMRTAILFFVLSLTSLRVIASGCGGYGGLQLGNYLDRQVIKGRFSCREHADQYYCVFESADTGKYIFSAVTPYKPPTGTPLELGVDVFEASVFDDCDGHEIPGILKRSYYAGTLYENFELN